MAYIKMGWDKLRKLTQQPHTWTGVQTWAAGNLFKQIATPTTPDSGYHGLYFKADGYLYTKNSAGVEVAVVTNVNLDAQNSVKSIAVCTSAPPTEVADDRYILDETAGTVHANWDGAAKKAIVQFDGTVWVATTPTEGMICEVEDVNTLYLYLTSWNGWQNQATLTTSGPTFATLTLTTGAAVGLSLVSAAGGLGTWGIAGTSYYAQSAGTAGIAGTAAYATSASNAGTAGTAAFATSAANAGSAGSATTAAQSGTAYYATTAGTAGISGTASFATSAGNSGTASAVVLVDAGKITWDIAPASDHTATGDLSSELAGETVAFGDLLYLKSDGEWYLADADASTTMPGLRMAVGAGTDGVATNVISWGVIRDDSWNWTIGGLIYASTTGTTTNTLTQTAPSGDGDQVQIVGYALTADVMVFAPCPVVTEIGLDIEAKDSGYTITWAELTAIPKCFTCDSASDRVFDFLAPTAADVGKCFRIVKSGTDAGKITIDLPATIFVEDSTDGGTIYCTAALRASITLQLVTATKLAIVAAAGTWTTT